MKKVMLIVALMGLVTLSAFAATYPAWDVNQDGKVDGKDLALVSLAFGSVDGSYNWNPLADINGDGWVDGRDIIFVAIHFGEFYK